MNPLTLLWTDLRNLVLDTGRLWWRLLPQLTAIYLLGWLGDQLALKLAAIVGDWNSWVALLILSTGFLFQLGALILMLRLAGAELGIRQMIPQEEDAQDQRDSSLSHLLAVTLLPFLGIYAAFGEVSKAAESLYTESKARNGAFGVDILAQLQPDGTKGKLIVAAVVVGAYIVRRIVDSLHERTGWRPLGLLVAFIESFFMLTVILTGQKVWNAWMVWLGDRAFFGWLARLRDFASGILAHFQIDLPAVLLVVSDAFGEHVWPTLVDVVSQPIIWLAVAALVFGSRVMSLAELWRKGQPLLSKAPIAGRLARVTERVPKPKPSNALLRLLAEIRSAFLGDIDDKYLPTFHSIRLVLRAGVIFLGAFILVYAVQDILENYLRTIVLSLVGGHDVEIWIVLGPYFDLLYRLPFEPFRVALLAVAFRRCLQLFMARAADSEQAQLPAAVVARAS